MLGGYSLAGLFALWSSYQTDMFNGIAAASPSVWFPQWIDYASENRPFAKFVYLSLGDKEEKAKNRWNSESHQARLNDRFVTEEGKANPVMDQVGNAIRKQHDLLTGQEVTTILEWNAGNLFVDSEKRMAEGFAWLMNHTICLRKKRSSSSSHLRCSKFFYFCSCSLFPNQLIKPVIAKTFFFISLQFVIHFVSHR